MKTKKLLSVVLTTICLLSGLCINYNAFTVSPEVSTVLGDANNDGKLSISDAAFIAKMIAKRKVSELPETADFNKDGKVSIKDATEIAKTLAKRKPATTTPKVTTKVTTKTTTKTVSSVIPATVYITKTGKRYHYSSTCNGGTYYSCSYKDAIAKGLTACSKCVH